MKNNILILPVLLAIFLISSCTASYDTYSTKNPQFNGKINKMLVVVLKLDSIIESDMEEEISNSLNYGGKRADSFIKIIPDTITVSEILELMKEKNYDGLLVVSPYEGNYTTNPEIPEIKLDGTEKKGDIIKSYIDYKSKSSLHLSVGYFLAEVALFKISDEMLVWRSSFKTETKVLEFMGSRVSKLGQAIFEELKKKTIIN